VVACVACVFGTVCDPFTEAVETPFVWGWLEAMMGGFARDLAHFGPPVQGLGSRINRVPIRILSSLRIYDE
jgi:hypothetical protein